MEDEEEDDDVDDDDDGGGEAAEEEGELAAAFLSKTSWSNKLLASLATMRRQSLSRQAAAPRRAAS